MQQCCFEIQLKQHKSSPQKKLTNDESATEPGRVGGVADRFSFFFLRGAVPWQGVEICQSLAAIRAAIVVVWLFFTALILFSRNLPRHFIHSMCAISFSFFLFYPRWKCDRYRKPLARRFSAILFESFIGRVLYNLRDCDKKHGRHFARDFLLVTPSLYRIEYLTSTFFCFTCTKRNPC